MCADIGIHDKGDGNPHAHVLLTMRPLKHDGTFGAKSQMEYILDDNGEKIKLPSGRYRTRKIRTVDWDNRGNAEMWRENWANTLNKYLEYYEHEMRVDHRSYVLCCKGRFGETLLQITQATCLRYIQPCALGVVYVHIRQGGHFKL